MDQYKKWLALNVLNEDRVINYRQLSRALKVHTHLAKQMLYDFHHNQNAKKPESVHATYLITGTVRTGPPAPSTNGTLGDSFLQSSPFPSSMPEPDTDFEIDPDENPVKEDVPTITIHLVQEEQLEEAQEEFEDIHSIFVYSLEAGPIKDIQRLTTCNRDIVTQFSSEDPLESYKTYGIPHNPNVKRRTNKRPMPSTAPPAAKAVTKPAPKTTPVAKEVAPPAAKLSRSTSDQTKSQKKNGEPKASTPSLQREKSDLFKSFAKTKPPKAKPLAHGTATPMSEDEAEDEDVVMEETEEQKQKAEASRKARQEQAEALKKMMEDSDEDEPMADAPTVDEAVEEGSPIDELPPKEDEKQETVTVQGGRRRGKRQVIKKRTMKDDEGYLVTKEEAVWESFSEEEPEPKKKKTNFPAPTTAKGKKGTGKPGQGNIMSFFGKKFHVDNLSSAHIYLRMNEGDSWDNISPELLEDCAQLTKANSIDGNKKDNVTIIYTPWSNLKKDGSMATGQVGFHNQKMVKRIHVAARTNAIVNRLNKTKVEKFPDLRQEKEDRLKELRNRDRAGQLARQKEEKRIARENKEKAWQKEHAYDDIFTAEAVEATSNQDRGSDFEDDFM
ncbi:hypothetical protein FKW77_002607 [Venturia effusa]|uniref:NFACT RNA-binding domain-containing protein n=1 Tax=Venturia effusa TaxID=50376 RepID=A0A517LC58_9PEZI|nr:hypothetical protein FKW77_002607 [Venturia effusa]